MKSSLLLLSLLVMAVCPALAADSVVVFNEIHYHPTTNETANEWVELHNQMAIDIDLSAWAVKGGIDFTFAEGTIISGGGYLVVAGNPSALQSATGATNVVGPFTGRLNNSSGRLELRDRNDRLMDRLEYGDGGKWSVAPDGSGATLAKSDPDSISDSPDHWTSSVLVGGTPGRRNFPAAASAQRRSLVPFDGLWRFESSGTDLGSAWRAPGFDDSAWSGRNNATLISYWPFNGNANATFGTSGTLVGTVTATTDRNGAAGGALAFNGALQHYVNVAGGGGLDGKTAGTISLWVKWVGTQDADCCGTFGAIFARQSNGLFSDNVISLSTSDPNTARIVWRQTSAGPGLITGTTAVGANWHHVAITFAPAGSTLYLDGVAQGSGVGGGLHSSPGIPLTIGAWSGDGAGFMTGSLDDVAIWDTPLSAAQIAQLAAQTKSPPDFSAPESAVYFAGDGRLASNDELRRTALPLGPNTYYFRHAFPFADDPAGTELKLDLAVDDGAVFYLNGAEVYRHNMPAGAVNYSTLAASAIGDAPLLNGISVPATNLVLGTNVFAVEVHQAAANDLGMVFSAGLNATIAPPPPTETRTLVALAEAWKFDASNTDLGSAWRAPAYNDAAWSNGPALLFAGNAGVVGVPPERITTITATASSEYTDGRRAVDVVNGAGLVGNAHVVNPPIGTMWLNNGTLAVPNDLNPFITFDLGSAQPLRSMKVWNYNEDLPDRPELLSRGVSLADVFVAGTDGVFTRHLAGQTLNKAPGTETDFSQTIDLGNVTARYVKLDKLTNFPGGDFNFVGLSEVQFFRDANLKRTEVALGPVTYYFRKAFNFSGDPAGATLSLNLVADDGAVVYLNGVEVYRLNMTAGPVTHFTLASVPVGQPTFTGPLAIPAAALINGVNVLAVEVHETAADSDMDMIFGAELTATVTTPGPEAFASGDLVFNEISTAGAVPFQIELVNRGADTLDVGGYVVQRTGHSPDAEHTLPSQSVPAGGFLVLDQVTLGFGAAAGDKLFLLRPGRRGVADSLEVHGRTRARRPDGEGDWLTPNAPTLGASNTFTLRDEVVINEIMYHAPPLLPEAATFSPTNALIILTNVWRYRADAVDLGGAWSQPAYDDSLWLMGAALFYAPVSAVTFPVPKNTFVALTNGSGVRILTFYFRTQFMFAGDTNGLMLGLRALFDDGAVFYLNGVEVLRTNMPTTNITYNTLATVNVGIPGLSGLMTIPAGSVRAGLNTLAVEVHQVSSGSSDVNLAAELVAWNQLTPALPFRGSPEQWVELFNRSSNAVSLAGWRLDEGVDFRFASNAMVPPGGHLVVAKDPAALSANFPAISVVGPFTNKLSHRGERLVLRDAADNPADAVRYFDNGRWPKAADAGGASLELRDPRADHNAAESWAASNERGRTAWRTYSYRGVAVASPVGPDTQWHEFVIGMLDAGEVLLDDISVIESPTNAPVQLVQNATFDTGLSKWRIIGNHHGEIIDDPDQPGNKVLRLVATGSTEHMSNHGETTFVGNRDVVNGREYLISFRARWVSGSRQLHTRLYFNRLARTTLLDLPARHGTPGARNTAFTTNLGPTFAALRHEPAVPAPFEPVTVSVLASDPDGVSALTLWSRPDGGSWQSAPMTPDSSPFNSSTLQPFSASLPGRPAGTVIQFYIEATDGLGAKSFFPADGTNSRALYKVDDGLAATNGLRNFRLVTLAADADDLLRQINLMSNERIGCTMIYDEREIFYDVGLRLKGSEHSRVETLRLGFNVGFDSDHLFRGVHRSVALDRSESVFFGQREMLMHQTLNHCGGLPTKYHDLVQVMAPRPQYTGAAELQLARYTDVFLDDQFKDGGDGTVYEYELVYQLNSTDNGTPEGNKLPAADSVVGTGIRNLGADKEGYRWTMLIKNNEDRDDFSRIIPFCQTMELTGAAFTSGITNVIDVDQWLRGVAVNVLSGMGDSYGGDGSAHNVQFYARPSDGRVLYFPHDMDAFFSASRSIVPNGEMTKLLTVPAFARAYYCHLLELMATTYNANYMTRWANHFGRLLPAQPFAGHLSELVARANNVASQINSSVPSVAFAITTSGGNNFGTSSNVITLTGTGWLNVKTIEVNGVSYPITWTSATAWSLQIPLYAGTNLLVVQGANRAGLRLTNALDTITVTNTGSGALLPVVINEWMADNRGPNGFPDPLDGLFQDWFELFNPNSNAVNLAGFFLTDDLGEPTKWPIPAGTGAVLAPRGFRLVWADDQPEQNALSTNGDLHTSFHLDADGEALGLFSPGGVLQHGVTFGPQTQNVSEGLFPDGVTNTIYSMTNWTPRAANTLAGPLRFVQISIAAGVVTLTWDAIPGRTYVVEFKDNFDARAWTQLDADVMAAAEVASAMDVVGPNDHRFYRVRRVE